jgi:hypothetical protein
LDIWGESQIRRFPHASTHQIQNELGLGPQEIRFIGFVRHDGGWNPSCKRAIGLPGELMTIPNSVWISKASGSFLLIGGDTCSRPHFQVCAYDTPAAWSPAYHRAGGI